MKHQKKEKQTKNKKQKNKRAEEKKEGKGKKKLTSLTQRYIIYTNNIHIPTYIHTQTY